MIEGDPCFRRSFQKHIDLLIWKKKIKKMEELGEWNRSLIGKVEEVCREVWESLDVTNIWSQHVP